MIILAVEKIKKYVPINDIDEIVYFEAYLTEAQEGFIAKYLGQSLTKELDDYVAAEQLPDSITLNALLAVVEPALCFYAYYLAIPALDIAHTSAGFAVVQNTNQAPASKERVANLRASMFDNAQKTVERLLLFLEKNTADYPTWASSDAYFEWTKYFVNSCAEFDKIVSIDESRLKYLQLRPSIEEAEQLHIEPAITAELAAEIRTQAFAGTLTAANRKIYELVKRASAYKAFAIHHNEPNKAATAEMYISRAVNTILATPADYPSAAALFPTTRTKRVQYFENLEENGFYIS